MRKFKESHPSYKSYSSPLYHVNEIPSGFSDAIIGLSGRYMGKTKSLRELVDIIRSFIPEGPTDNWSENYLQGDLYRAFRSLEKSFHKYLDALGEMMHYLKPPPWINDDVVENFNEYFTDSGFGYIAEDGVWKLRDDSVNQSLENLQQTLEVLPDKFQIAMSHLVQAVDQISRGDTDRILKDAIGDVLSAIESLYKSITETDDFQMAVQQLKKTDAYGSPHIVKEGKYLWDKMHELYPDTRHGTREITALEKAEAFYWLDRMTAWVRYISRAIQE